MNYQIAWGNTPYGKVVSSTEEAKALKQELLQDYWDCYQDGVVDKYDTSDIMIVSTTKKVGTED